jgi:glycosyltransferase involved in cell wall biosynthesis
MKNQNQNQIYSQKKKPRILLLPDVPNWAWEIKSRYIQKYLSDEFEIKIQILESNRNVSLDFDIYMVYTPAHLKHLGHVEKKKRIAGVTGHYALDKHIKGKNIEARTAAVHANSRILERELKKYHSKVYYVPNGVDLDLFPYRPPTKHKQLVVGFLGKTLPGKGVADTIKPAVNSVNGTIFVQKAKNWKNAKPIETLSNFYASLDLYLVASTIDGTPNPALEAAATGRPIIANNIGNMPELIENGVNGFLVPRKKGEYIQKLQEFVKNPTLVETMGRAARKTIEEHWDWKIQAENYRQMFRETLECQES